MASVCEHSVLSPFYIGWTSSVLVVISAIVGWSPTTARDFRYDGASNCDREFSSRVDQKGTFSSPGYPRPHRGDITCRYRFHGYGRERVQIIFKDVDLNTPNATMLTKTHERCNHVDSLTVTIFIGGHPRDIGVFCGHQKSPMLMSNNNRLEVTFVSRSITPVTRGFLAEYRFVENFGISAGEIAKDMVCGFVFKSRTAQNGTFTSPNYPGMYPRDTECHYLFYGADDEKVHITFPSFDVEGIPPHCRADTQSDYVEFSNFNVELMDRKMRRMCGKRSPNSRAAVTSDGSFFRVTFKSNDAYDAVGFEAFYQFLKYVDPYKADDEQHRTLVPSRAGASSLSATAAVATILRLQLTFIFII